MDFGCSRDQRLIGRRSMLVRSGMGMAALGLAELCQDDLSAMDANSAGAMAVKMPHFPGRAKRVIHFFLNGGPSHVDTFDPKPRLAHFQDKTVPELLPTERKTGVAFPSPFQFKRYGQSGLEVSELFSKTAEFSDDMAVVRSMYAQVPNHEPSLMLMNCGDSIRSRPSVGAWTLYGLGTENQNLPGFIAMCPGGYPIKDAENWQSGFLPGAYQGTFVDSKERQVEKLIENIQHSHVSDELQSHQLELLRKINQSHLRKRGDERLEARIQSFELAFRMQSEAMDAFDLSRETKETRDLYGDHIHGRQTLIARRLAERGVRYIQLWHGAGQPWDHHDNIKANHERMAKEIDQPIAALLGDLKRSGMLEDTLVIWGGEFGRTPTVELNNQGQSKLGRDHNHYGFTVWMAGGGIKGGTVHGATDELGFKAVENPTSVHDLHATILHLLGFDHEKLTYRYAGRDFRLTDVHGQVIAPIVL